MNGRADILRERPAGWEDAPDLREELERRLADFSSLAFRVAYGVLRQREDAEDVAQEALALAFERLRTLRNPERFQSWLVRTCWRAALDHRRAQERRERRERIASAPQSTPDPEDLAAASEFRERRVVVILSRVQEHGSAEVSALLGLPPGTVRSRLHAARRRLMKALE